MKKKHFKFVTVISLLSLFIIVTSLALNLDTRDMYGKIPLMLMVSLVILMILRNNIKVFLLLQAYFFVLFYLVIM